MTPNCLLLSVMAPSLAHKVTFGSNCCTCGWEKLPLLVCILKEMLVYSPNNSPRLPVWRISTTIVALLLITSYYSLLQLVGQYQSNLKIVSSTTHLDPMLNLSLLLKESIHLIWNTELAWSCTLSESALLIKHRRLATWNPAPIVDSGISQQRNVRLRPKAAIKISHGKNARVANCLTQVPLRPTVVFRKSNWFSERMWTKHLFHGKAMQSLVLSPSNILSALVDSFSDHLSEFIATCLDPFGLTTDFWSGRNILCNRTVTVSTCPESFWTAQTKLWCPYSRQPASVQEPDGWQTGGPSKVRNHDLRTEKYRKTMNNCIPLDLLVTSRCTWITPERVAQKKLGM